MDSDAYHEWTPCEMYGHVWLERKDKPGSYYCPDCGDEYHDSSRRDCNTRALKDKP